MDVGSICRLAAVTKIGAGAIVILIGLVATSLAAEAGPVFDDIKARGSRNIWVSVNDPASMKRLAENGFNAATAQVHLLKEATSTTGPDDAIVIRESDIAKERLDLIRAQARECAKHGLLYMPYINQLSDWETKILTDKNYRRVVNQKGAGGGISPCPLERKDWFGLQLPQMLALVRILAEEGCEGGVMLEAETYCAGDIYPGYHTQRQSFCYCDHCWRLFVAKLPTMQRPEGNMKPAERYPWLSANGLLWQYEQSEREELVKILREVAAEVRKVKPDTIFSMYPCTITWYNDAIVEGLGTEELPFLLYSATEYYRGCQWRRGTSWEWANGFSTSDQLRHFRALGAPHIYQGGLSVGTYWPQRMGLEMVRLLESAEGFWLYWGGTLLAEDGAIGIVPGGGSEWVLREQPSLYWPSIKAANDAGAGPGEVRRDAASSREKEIWKDVTFDGPEGKPLVWDVKNPPPCKTGLPPSIDKSKRALVFDLNAETPEPKAQMFEYTFNQQAGMNYIQGARVRYEGDPVGARLALGWSYPAYDETDGRKIYQSINWVLVPQDGWTWLVRTVNPTEKDQDGWISFQVQPNPGRVLVSSVFFAPSSDTKLESPTLELAEGATWGSVRWKMAGADRSYFTVDVFDALTDRQLYNDIPNGFDLGNISRVYGLNALKIVLTCHVPAGDKAVLRSLTVAGAR